MSTTRRAARVALAIQQAESGVDYSARDGARCPWCDKRLKVVTTKPWDGNVRVRFHRCMNRRCYLWKLAKAVKSVQVDQAAGV